MFSCPHLLMWFFNNLFILHDWPCPTVDTEQHSPALPWRLRCYPGHLHHLSFYR